MGRVRPACRYNHTVVYGERMDMATKTISKPVTSNGDSIAERIKSALLADKARGIAFPTIKSQCPRIQFVLYPANKTRADSVRAQYVPNGSFKNKMSLTVEQAITLRDDLDLLIKATTIARECNGGTDDAAAVQGEFTI